MPARDIYHKVVIDALIADGWTITDDPLFLSYGGQDLYVDLGAERNTIAAEKNGEQIAVEIKSFVSLSVMTDLEKAMGQYFLYETILAEVRPGWLIYLAIPLHIYDSIFAEKFGQAILKRHQLRLIVFDDKKARIAQWIK